MFKKKQSEINVQPQRTYSPFRPQPNNSQLTRTPNRSNLSPMKTHIQTQQYKTKSPRKQFICEPYSAGKQLNHVRRFQTQLENLGNQIGFEYQCGPVENGVGYRSKYIGQTDDSSYGSCANYQTTDRTMKESKKVFSNALSKMNSDKKKNQLSNQNSVFQQSKHQGQTTPIIPIDHLPIASFKALKQIKMIESVHPLAPPPLLQKSLNKKHSHNSSNAQKQSKQSNTRSFRGVLQQNSPVEQFKAQQKTRKQMIVQLINQSFSLNPSNIDHKFSEIELAKQKVLQGKEKYVMESLYIDQSLEFKELNTIISKIDGGGNPQHQIDSEAQSVKGSMESAKFSLTMNPFL